MVDATERKRQNIKFLITTVVIIFISVLADQLTKLYFHKLFGYPASIPPKQVLGTWLQFTFTMNPGASWGLFANLESRNIIFFIFTIVGLPLFSAVAWSSRNDSAVGSYGITLAMGGILGNALDRMLLGNGFFDGFVRDFIDWKLIGAIFNVADACMAVGIVLYVVGILFVGKSAIFKKKEKQKQSE